MSDQNKEEVKIPEGYRTVPGANPAEDKAGPYYYRKDEDGVLHMCFIATKDHGNKNGGVHGGMLMHFADYIATMVALSGVKESVTSVSFNSDFISYGPINSLLEGRGEVVRRTGSMVFVRGEIFTGDKTLLIFSAVLKRLKPRD